MKQLYCHFHHFQGPQDDEKLKYLLIGAAMTGITSYLMYQLNRKKEFKTKKTELRAMILGLCEKLIRQSIMLEKSVLSAWYFEMAKRIFEEAMLTAADQNRRDKFKERNKYCDERNQYFVQVADKIGIQFEEQRTDLNRYIEELNFYLPDSDTKFLNDTLKEFDSVHFLEWNDHFKDMTLENMNKLDQELRAECKKLDDNVENGRFSKSLTQIKKHLTQPKK
jgi:hypothetical protein